VPKQRRSATKLYVSIARISFDQISNADTSQVPSCSRCITKGIKCQPRSTRRTSDNNNRASIRKSSRLPRRDYATNAVSCLELHTPTMSLFSHQEPSVTYEGFYIDTGSIAKSSHKDLRLSGYPMLTPLPSQGSQVSNDCYAYVESPEYDSNFFVRPVDTNNYLNLGAISPQTPGPVILYEPASVVNDPDCYLYPESWSSEVHMSNEVGFGVNGTTVLPEMWATPDSMAITSATQIPCPLSDLSNLQRHTMDESTSHISGIPSTNQYQSRNALDPVRPEWTFYSPTVTDMAVVPSAPFMYDFNSATNYAPVWELPFIL
jgi:hypothetical protein